MRVKSLITCLLLTPTLLAYAENTQPGADFLEYLASLESVDGELLDPIEVNDMLESQTKPPQENSDD